MTEHTDVLPGGVRLRFSDLLIEEWLAAVALGFVVLAVCWGVATRYILSTPAAWSGEVATIAFAWVVFLGSAAAFRRSGHIMIDSLLRIVPNRLRWAIEAAASIIVLVTLLVVTLLAARFTLSTADAPTTILRLPQSIIYGAAAFGFALMTIRHITASIETLFGKRAQA